MDFVDPATQTPLFTAEWITCAYPVSDLYATSPRYLYYVLLVMVFITQWHSWLANVFLGVVAAYAGTAAIEAFILITNRQKDYPSGNVTIPYIDSATVANNGTLNTITNLISDQNSVVVQPASLDFDLDAVIAITVTGYLMMLPMHCWSSAVRANRARHLLILLWNVLMFAGMICSIVLWPTSFDAPLQYRFCYPDYVDTDTVTADGLYTSEAVPFNGDWNQTIWDLFSNSTRALNLNTNCFYPCFNTTQILRRTQTLQADLSSQKSPRLSIQLFEADLTPTTNVFADTYVINLMYVALPLTTSVMMLLLCLAVTPLGRLTRVPIAKPREVLWTARKELFHVLRQDAKRGIARVVFAIRSPRDAYSKLHHSARSTTRTKAMHFLRFWLDILAILILFMAMFIAPATVVIFVVFIEWYIHRDLVSSEAPQQVGQWTTSVSVALVLISALVLRLRYVIASRSEIEHELAETQAHLRKLEELLSEKDDRN